MKEVKFKPEFRQICQWIAEYAYRKANPNSTMDVPSMVYEQAEKDFGNFCMEKEVLVD